jgi:ubiquinone/menaquinone biosynthesis C-methylase UbiE
MKRVTTTIEQEIARIQEEYTYRANCEAFAARYSLFNEATLLQLHSIERNLLALLKRHKFTELADKKILDIGCGTGMHLQRFLAYGAQPGNLAGIDLMPERIALAKQMNPAIDWRQGSAHELPYPDASFDLITLFVVFSSILNEPLRQRIADEIWRVRKPGGLILCYDFTYSNPRNPAVVGISRQHIRYLFQHPGAQFDFRRITLAPPLARFIAPRAYGLVSFLEQIKLLNTHIICSIKLDDKLSSGRVLPAFLRVPDSRD